MRSAHFAYAVATVLAVTVLPSMATAAVAADPVSDTRPIPAPRGVAVTDPSTSADGRWVAFVGQVGGVSAIYRYDSRDETTERVVTQDADGDLLGRFAETTISGDGDKIAFTVYDEHHTGQGWDPHSQVYLTDLRGNQPGLSNTTLMSGDFDGYAGNDGSAQPALSADGKFLAFTTRATDVVNGQRRDEVAAQGADIALRSLDDGRIDGISEVVSGVDMTDPSVSGDGSRVVYTRDAATSQPSVWLFERPNGVYGGGETRRQLSSGDQPSLSVDGDHLALRRQARSSGAASAQGAFLRDLTTGAETRVDPRRGSVSNPQVSGDGSHVLVSTVRSQGAVPELWVRDLVRGTNTKVASQLSQSGSAASFALSADGTRVWWSVRAPVAVWNPLVWRAAVSASGQGYVLQADPADWGSGTQAQVTRQWLRDGRPIHGATSLTYEVTAADIGRQLALRERLVVTGAPTGQVTSRAYHVKPDRSVLLTPKKIRLKRGKKVVVRVRVAHRPGGESYFGGSVAPQGEVRVRLGKKSTVSTVGRRGWVRLVLPAQRPGKYHVRVTHRGTRFAVHAPAKKISLVVRSSR